MNRTGTGVQQAGLAALGFIVGMLAMYLLVALPLLLATFASIALGPGLTTFFLGFAFGAAVAVSLCFFVGTAFGRHWTFEASGSFLIGFALTATAMAAQVFLSGAAGPNYVGGAAYLLSGGAFLIGFRRGRSAAAGTPVAPERVSGAPG